MCDSDSACVLPMTLPGPCLRRRESEDYARPLVTLPYRLIGPESSSAHVVDGTFPPKPTIASVTGRAESRLCERRGNDHHGLSGSLHTRLILGFLNTLQVFACPYS